MGIFRKVAMASVERVPCLKEVSSSSTHAQEDGALTCAICYEVAPELIRFPAGCGHRFCMECTEKWCAKIDGCQTCPMCRAASIPRGTRPAKLEALEASLQAFRERLAAERQEREAAKRPPRTCAGLMTSRIWQRLHAALDEGLSVAMHMEQLATVNAATANAQRRP